MPDSVYFTMFKDYSDIVNIKQICQMLGIGERTAYRLINDGKLKRISCGRTIRVAKYSVIEYVVGNIKSDAEATH